MDHLRKKFAPGDVLLREKEPYDGFFLLEKGRVKIELEGKRIGGIDTADGPEFVGEISALLNVKRNATVIAETECTAVWLPVNKLEDVLETVPSLGVKLARSLARKLDAANLRMERGHEFGLVIVKQLELLAASPTQAAVEKLLDRFSRTNPWGVVARSFQVVAGKKSG